MRYAVIVLAAWLAPTGFGQPATLQNAQVQARSAAGGLQAAMQTILAAQSAPAWVAYAVPAVAGQHSMCCYNSWQCYSGCSLEGRTSECALPPVATCPIQLEGPKQFYVFYRIDRNQVDRVRVFSPDCAVDAGGLALLWLNDVKPAESVAYLTSLARDPDRHSDSTMVAIAMHAAPEAIATLTDMARNSSVAHQRSQALAWLARTASPTVSQPIIDEAIAKDPSTEVKRQAVFALSQIPHNDGVPRMIQLARTTQDANVRKQAMLWLGRAKDDRAYRFFQEILTK